MRSTWRQAVHVVEDPFGRAAASRCTRSGEHGAMTAAHTITTHGDRPTTCLHEPTDHAAVADGQVTRHRNAHVRLHRDGRGRGGRGGSVGFVDDPKRLAHQLLRVQCLVAAAAGRRTSRRLCRGREEIGGRGANGTCGVGRARAQQQERHAGGGWWVVGGPGQPGGRLWASK